MKKNQLKYLILFLIFFSFNSQAFLSDLFSSHEEHSKEFKILSKIRFLEEQNERRQYLYDELGQLIEKHTSSAKYPFQTDTSILQGKELFLEDLKKSIEADRREIKRLKRVLKAFELRDKYQKSFFDRK